MHMHIQHVHAPTLREGVHQRTGGSSAAMPPPAGALTVVEMLDDEDLAEQGECSNECHGGRRKKQPRRKEACASSRAAKRAAEQESMLSEAATPSHTAGSPYGRVCRHSALGLLAGSALVLICELYVSGGSVGGGSGGSIEAAAQRPKDCLLYTSPSPRDRQKSRMPSSA